ncbi:hypothetical protein RND71_024307 [Anisodus tanguticus]|uniref:Chalcone-flavonone isomerase family protein n=1 Tax=Anisodus tanguticus TaxID=243964 RepID=A0AAE1RPD6_9SOLA|nr:hypothetical protein RND71_024307 [Anisodus tanguticus]
MAAAGAISVPLWISTSTTPTKITACNTKSRISYPLKLSRNGLYPLSTFERNGQYEQHFTPKAASSSSVGSTEYTEEPATKVKFQRSLSLAGCSTSLSLLGTGYREKIFAIIGVKVYAAGLYVNDSVFSRLDAWRGRSAAEIQQDPNLFNMIFEAISPRIKSPTADDKSALSTFCGVFQGKPLKNETSIFLTWIDPTKMLVSMQYIYSVQFHSLLMGSLSSVDAAIESTNVAAALFDVFLGGDPVSPTLKTSVAKGMEVALK